MNDFHDEMTAKPSSSINWYPGHMLKAKREIQENLKHVHVVVEVVDARIPRAGRNPDIDSLAADKARIIVLNKSDLADGDVSAQWHRFYNSQGWNVLLCSAKDPKTAYGFKEAVRKAASAKLEAKRLKGIQMAVKAMVIGIPNVGKSTLINCVAGSKRAKAEDRPGVTRGKQWIHIDSSLELLDMPGMLWPKIENERDGILLSATGAIKDQINDLEYVCVKLLELLNASYYGALNDRYKLPDTKGLDGHELLELICKKRGFIMSGGLADTERGAHIVIDEYRAAKIGRFTLDTLEEPV